jgi:protease-4
MNLLNTIIDSPWMLAPSTAQAHLPSVIRLLKGDEVRFRENKTPAPYAFLPTSRRKIRHDKFSQAPDGSVAVYTIKGVVLKEDGWCSDGTETLMRKMAEADEMNNISAHLLEIDSGGGQGSNIQTVARFIREELKKPVIAWFNGIAASAAYYIAAAADEVYASENTDIVGSVGVMLSFFDFREFYENSGIKLHEIYADQSDLKNKDYQKARDGDYEDIKAAILNPMALQFQADIKKYRPELKNEDAYKGKVFTAYEAVIINMIDGIKSFDAAIDRALQLSNHVQKEEDMNKIESVLGYELETNTEGGVFLQSEELQKLNANLASNDQEVVSTAFLDKVEATIKDQDAKIAALENTVTALAKNVVTYAEFEQFKAEAATAPTEAFSAEDPAVQVVDAADELDRITREAAEAGATLRVE